jgi:16S rRNA (guanine1207-N2)-methyltransferase
VELKRYPASKNNSLQAWNAADSYLLEYLHSSFSLSEDSKVLIFNDAFGALTLSLIQFKTTSITDSYLSKKAIEINAQVNNYESPSIVIDYELKEKQTKYDFILIKLPKITDYLHEFLCSIRYNLHEKSVILMAGMVKNMPKTLWTLLENEFGLTKTSLTKRKAKIIELKYNKSTALSRYPQSFTQENTALTIFSYANVFSKSSLDIGTRFLLQNMPEFPKPRSIIDLGCGNGIIGLNLAIQYPKARITFVDESFMSIKSAHLTCTSNSIDTKQHLFKINDCLTGFDNNSCDLIVCNPPFHQSHDLSIDTALKMFYQSYATLVEGGHFLVIANRHLPYYSHLKRIYKNCETVASNRKFNLFLMVK